MGVELARKVAAATKSIWVLVRRSGALEELWTELSRCVLSFGARVLEGERCCGNG